MSIYLQAKNIPLAASAMSKMRSIIGYFDKSAQTMTKLVEFQRSSHLNMYRDQQPKKPLQDVMTRWWSTYRAINRLKILKKAIRSLIIVGEVDCEDQTDEEWLVLDQILILLETMAHFQRILEGESYVTGSLVAVAVFQIRQAYVEVLECAETEPAVRCLAELLLSDFDNRYHPACSNTGKVKYHREDTVGRYKRFGIHQYFFVASILDPRFAPLLSEMMTTANYNQLKLDVIDFLAGMLTKANNKHNNNTYPKPSAGATASHSGKNYSKSSQLKDKMFCGLNIMAQATPKNDSNENDTALQAACASEFERYLHDALDNGACPLYDENDSFNDPLKWWKANCIKYPYVANVARKYLAIPATSAPSERVWSRSARILSLRRASLCDDLVGRMMYVKKNLVFLHQHYCQLRKK